jgi:hypothetical protein
LIKLNVEVALYRRNSMLHDWPVLEVVGVSAVTAAISYLVCLDDNILAIVVNIDIGGLFAVKEAHHAMEN